MTKRRIAAAWCAFMILCGLVGLATLPANGASVATAPVIDHVEIGFGADHTITKTVNGVQYGPSTNAVYPPLTTASTSSTGTASATSTASTVYYFNGYRFASRFICQQNAIGVNWDILGAGNAFENSSVVTAVLTYRYINETNPDFRYCSSSGYAGSQVINYLTYSAGDGQCKKLRGDAYATSGVWYSSVTIYMNTYYYAALGCRDTAQHRSYHVSQATGYALGLDSWSASPCTSYPSIENLTCWDTYSYAGGLERTNVWQIYS